MSNNIRFRIGGLVAIALGLGLGWWGIWQPMAEARAQVPNITFHTKLFALVPTCLVFGLAFLLAGDSLKYRNEEEQKLTTVGWALFAVVAVAAAVAGVRASTTTIRMRAPTQVAKRPPNSVTFTPTCSRSSA